MTPEEMKGLKRLVWLKQQHIEMQRAVRLNALNDLETRRDELIRATREAFSDPALYHHCERSIEHIEPNLTELRSDLRQMSETLLQLAITTEYLGKHSRV